MKKLVEINGADTHLFRIFDKICFNKFVTGGERINLSYFDGKNVHIIEPGLFYDGAQIGKSYLWQPLNGKGLKIWDENFNIVREETWEIYFASIKQFFADKLIAVQVENGASNNYLYSEDLSRKSIVSNYKVAKAGRNFICIKPDYPGAEAFGIEDALLKWKINLSIVESPKRFDVPGKDKGLNKVDATSGPCGNNDSAFLPLKYGQLVAVDATDGHVKWIKDYGGYTACFDNHLYHLNGPELTEINTKNGDVEKKIEFSKSIGKSSVLMTSPFKVYEDVILLQGSQSIIVLIDRKSFEVIDWFQPSGWESTRIPADNRVMHWCNNCVYVVDMNGVLHIYSLE